MTYPADEVEEKLVDVPELFLFLRRAVPDATVVTHDRAFINNIAFALQYLDHLLQTIAAPDVRITIHSQTCKSIVMCGMGIVEAILWFGVKKAGQANTSSWQESSKQTGTPFDRFGKRLRIDSILMEEVSPPQHEEMTLDTLIKKVESRGLLGLSDHRVYGTLKALRQLRNRVHIHDVGTADDTDWYKFTGREVVMLLNCLNAIFSTNLFNPEPHHIDLLSFLDPVRVERKR
ncbi:MAG: hypothetical protein P0Y59_21635 [Candidatus Sphingomonas phytovorans]|nr:hypothetical protein [Sphingomonas sp.]WEJ99483.1 MAG: hypothetical protein P0Y59_21635 [Sphingomonas sp.]